MSRYQAPPCPRCGSAPLLDAPSDRAAFLCPACLGYFRTDLTFVPRVPEPLAMEAGSALIASGSAIRSGTRVVSSR